MQARTRPQAAAEGRDDDDGAVRGVALLVVTDGGGWRWYWSRGSAPLSLRDGATREEGIERWLSLAMRCTSVAAGRGGTRGDEMRRGWARVRAGARLGLGGWLGRPRWRKKWPEAWLGWLSLTNE